MSNYVVDTSVIIEKIVSKLVKKKEIEGTIIVPNAVVAELEAQANRGLEIGLIGLEELEELQNLNKENLIELKFIGARPTPSQIAYAKAGEIDALIREIAFNENATLITADKVQRQSAKVFGIEVMFIETKAPKAKIEIEKFFDDTTMSVHLKEDSIPFAKKGSPGNWNLVKISEKIFTNQQVQDMAKEIVEAAKMDPKSFVEISRPGSTIVQYKNHRIVIVKPPLSDGWEITAVKPIKRLSLEEYNLPSEILDRIENKARGIIIAGETGSGKCLPKDTFVYTYNGRKYIQDINERDEVLCIDDDGLFKTSKVSKTFKRTINKTLRIKTNFGKEIETTNEHPLLTILDNKPQWIPAELLREGDRIATLRKLEQVPLLEKINWIDKVNKEVIAVITKKSNFKLPVEEFYKGQSRAIIKLLKERQVITPHELKSNFKLKTTVHIRRILKKLEEDKIIYVHKDKKPFSYSLVQDCKTIEAGDTILLKDLLKYLTKEEIYAITNYITKITLWHKCAKIKPINEITTDLAELIGYLIGESLTKYGICTDNKNAQERFSKISMNLFEIEVNKIRDIFSVYTDKYGTINEFLISCLELQPVQGIKKSRKHRIPSFIFTSPNYIKAALLRSYFDCESYIHPSKGIELISASKGLIQDIQALLLYFDITSTLRTKIVNDYKYTRLFIYGYNNMKKYGQNIGFDWKIEEYNQFVNKNKPGSPNKDTIPIGHLVYKISKRENLGLHKALVYHRGYSHERASNMMGYLLENSVNRESIMELKVMNFLISKNIQWDVITEKQEIDEIKDVYDIEVPYYHNFFAGEVPFIVHNSTFGRALAEFFVKKGKITKTIESPRDLDLPNEITQYGKNFASSEEIHDIILLSRPDNILFDEMRDTPDFKLYTDLRLAGSNLVGVLHAATPIDAVQRFIGRLDVGMIPSVLDTIIFIERGTIEKLLTLRMIVKVPTGMTEADLARPIVEVSDFMTSKVLYEIYSYGEETVVIPLIEEKQSPAKLLAEKQLRQQILKYCDNAEVSMLSDNKAAIYVPEKDIPRIIGKQGVMIEKIEKELGISIDVRELKDFTQKKKDIQYEINETGNSLIFRFSRNFINNFVSVYIGSELLFSATVGKKAEIKVNKKSEVGRKLIYGINKNLNIFVKL